MLLDDLAANTRFDGSLIISLLALNVFILCTQRSSSRDL